MNMKQVIHKWLEQYFGNEEAVLLTAILVVSLVVFVAWFRAVAGPGNHHNLPAICSWFYCCVGDLDTDCWAPDVLAFGGTSQHGW